ncbi:MAG: 1,6-anhydro-N-acetylmuramyl-L-alanine amidase AmpD [Gammaproteobacteria bacterium]|nr:1,6-anhydro-N-acetylmuramyl-L-alanine amidase AmpD [Gammaproteobacteria bacterium]
MYRIDPHTGLADGARQCASPNCDARPAGMVPELIIIHNISLPPGKFGGSRIDEFFCNRLDVADDPYFAEIADMQVSAHFLIRRDGELVQYVPVTQRAWHAGESCHAGRERCNDFSVGIELEGADEVPYDAAQYAALAALIEALRAAQPTLANADIVGHSDVAPGRKTDPGPAFDWQRLRTLVNG